MAEHENELAESRRCYQNLIKRFEATVEGPAAAAAAASLPVRYLLTVGVHGLERQKRFQRSAPQALAHLSKLDLSGDLGTFVADMADWARDALSFSYPNFSGQPFLRQIYKATNDPKTTARLLVEALRPPRDSTEAHRKINDLAVEVERIKSGGYPAPGSSAFLASYFWALQDRTNWPVSWLSARELIEYLTGEKLPPTSEPADLYQRYQQAIQEFDDDVEQFERVAVWWARNKADTL